MITVRNRTLIIPEGERVIGTDYDSNSEVRHFRVERAPGGVDISHLAFRIDLMYEGEIYDTCLLEREENEAGIIMTWNIVASNVAHVGTVWISLRGLDENGTVKWGTDKAPVYVRGSVNTPANVGITELEQYEKKVDDALKEMQETKEAADQATERANEALQNAESSIGKAAGSATSAANMADLAEAWAHGKNGYPDNDENNAKYWSDQSKSRAEAANTSAKEAKSEAERAAGYAESISPLEDKGLYVPETEYEKNDLVRYNNDLYRCKKDGVTSVPLEGDDWSLFLHSPSTLNDMTGTDVQGFLGGAGATGVNAQLLIDTIAEKVATQLLLKSDVTSQIINDATKAASAAAVYALQQRIGTGDLPSGMSDVVSGLASLYSNFEWKTLGTIIDGQMITLPQNINEVMFFVQFPDVNGNMRAFASTLTKDSFENDESIFLNLSNGISGENGCLVSIQIDKRDIIAYWLAINNKRDNSVNLIIRYR